MDCLVEARHIDVNVRQGRRELGEVAPGAAGLEGHPAARGPNEGDCIGQHRLERWEQSEIADECQTAVAEVCRLSPDEREVESRRRADMMGEAAFATGIDECGGRAGGKRCVRFKRGRVDSLGGQPRTHHATPEVVADQARRRHSKPQPLHGGARVADDASGGHLDRFDMEETASTHRL